MVCATPSRALDAELHAALGPPISRPFLVGGPADEALGLRGRLGGGYLVESASHEAEPAWLVHGARRETRPVAVVVLDVALARSRGIEAILQSIWTADPHVEVVLYAAPGDPIPQGIVREADEGGQVVVLRRPVDPVDLVLAVGSAAGRWSLREQLADASGGQFAVAAALQMLRPDPAAGEVAEALSDLGLALDEPTERVLDGVELMRDALESYARLVREYRRILSAPHTASGEVRAALRDAEAAVDFEWLDQNADSFPDAVADAVATIRASARALRHLATRHANGLVYFDVNASVEDALALLRSGSQLPLEVHTDLRPVPHAHCPVADLTELLREAIGRAAEGAVRRGGRRLVVTTRRKDHEVVVEIGSEPDSAASPRRALDGPIALGADRPIRIRLPAQPAASWPV